MEFIVSYFRAIGNNLEPLDSFFHNSLIVLFDETLEVYPRAWFTGRVLYLHCLFLSVGRDWFYCQFHAQIKVLLISPEEAPRIVGETSRLKLLIDSGRVSLLVNPSKNISD